MKNYKILFTKPETAELIEDEISTEVSGSDALIRTEYTAVSAGTERDNLRDEPNLYCILGMEAPPFPRHFGYSAVTSGKTVCQGYTALLNAMLKSAGIWCETVPGELTDRTPAEKHIWTRAMIDGEITYIDMTFGDGSRRSPNYEYFCVPRESLTRNRIWS